MSSRTKFKPPVAGDAYYDAEVMDNDDERWARTYSGDLDWSYTARTLESMTPDALVEYLVNNAFTTPARDYNPSAPFVHIKFAASQGGDGDGVTTISLPHGYRLPLMFVSKYLWATALRALPSEKEWIKVRGNLIHLCRLCENLFRRAHAKALQGGMEKGWRCVLFDRLLARFYKHWDQNDPNGLAGFIKSHSVREYDRDVLKHDWKRWCRRGLFGVKMTEEEVIDGITLEQNLGSLTRNPTTGRWAINGKPILHVGTQASPIYLTDSSLSSLSSDEEEEESSGGEGHQTRISRFSRKEEEEPEKEKEEEEEEEEQADIVMTVAVDASTGAGSSTKRPHDFTTVDDDEVERQAKRIRIKDVVNPRPQAGASSSTATLTNPAKDSNANSTTKTDSLVNPAPPSPVPVLSSADPWVPLPASAYQPFLDPNRLKQFLSTGTVTDTSATTTASASAPPQTRSSSRAPVPVAVAAAASGSGSGSVTESKPSLSDAAGPASVPPPPPTTTTGGPVRMPVPAPAVSAPGPSNARAKGTRSRPVPGAASQKNKQLKGEEMPAWKMLDSLVQPRGGKAPTGKGKEKEKPKAARVKAQKEKEKDNEALLNAGGSRGSLKNWAKKTASGEQPNAWHGPPASSSSILANAVIQSQDVELKPSRRISARINHLPAPGGADNDTPGTDSDVEFVENDDVGPGKRGSNSKGKDRLVADDDGVAEIPAHLVQAKALELLVSLVTDSRTGTSGNPGLAASVTALAAEAKFDVKANGAAAMKSSAPAGEASSSTSRSSSRPEPGRPKSRLRRGANEEDMKVVDGPSGDRNLALRLEDFEERFGEVKAELVTIVERLVVLESKDVERAARELLEDGGSLAHRPVRHESPGATQDLYVSADYAHQEDDPSTPHPMDVHKDLSITHSPSPTRPVQAASSSSTLVDKIKPFPLPPKRQGSAVDSIASSSGNVPIPNVDHHSVSEADGSELTTVNGPGKDVSAEGLGPALPPSISLLVEELVHTKMLSIMQEMGLDKLNTSTKPPSDAQEAETSATPPSPSLPTQDQTQEPTPNIATLLSELRALKAEFKDREQKDKEDKLAMRELHSAEVDALRRRLTYLENRDPVPLPMHISPHYYPRPYMHSEHSGSPGDYRSHPHHLSAPPGGEYFDQERSRRQSFPSYGGHPQERRLYADGDGRGFSSGEAHKPDGGYPYVSSATPVPQEKGKSAAQQHQQARVDTPPLPIKSQRKQHMMTFPRPK